MECQVKIHNNWIMGPKLKSYLLPRRDSSLAPSELCDRIQWNRVFHQAMETSMCKHCQIWKGQCCLHVYVLTLPFLYKISRCYGNMQFPRGVMSLTYGLVRTCTFFYTYHVQSFYLCNIYTWLTLIYFAKILFFFLLVSHLRLSPRKDDPVEGSLNHFSVRTLLPETAC